MTESISPSPLIRFTDEEGKPLQGAYPDRGDRDLLIGETVRKVMDDGSFRYLFVADKMRIFENGQWVTAYGLADRGTVWGTQAHFAARLAVLRDFGWIA